MSIQNSNLKQKIQESYSKSLESNNKSLRYAESIGYNQNEINSLPVHSVENSFGCGNPLDQIPVEQGSTILDIGSGAGIDTLLSAQRVGESGKVYGLDMTPAMIDKARQNALQAGYKNIEYILGDAEQIPLKDSMIDIVTSNCVINLTTDKNKVFKEIYRVLKPGGIMVISDIIIDDLPEDILNDINMYTSCIAGAMSENQLVSAIQKSGLKDFKIIKRQTIDKLLTSLCSCSSLDISQTDIQRISPYLDKIASIKFTARK